MDWLIVPKRAPKTLARRPPPHRSINDVSCLRSSLSVPGWTPLPFRWYSQRFAGSPPPSSTAARPRAAAMGSLAREPDRTRHPLWSDIEAADPYFAVPSQRTEFPLVFAAQPVINDQACRHDPYHAILTPHTLLGGRACYNG
jgi:hypothetical protein